MFDPVAEARGPRPPRITRPVVFRGLPAPSTLPMDKLMIRGGVPLKGEIRISARRMPLCRSSVRPC